MIDAIQMAEKIARGVRRAGGSTYYVGGFVRDALGGYENKDVDIEVHGIRPEQLERILDSLGERLEMGASFGIWGLKGCTLDIAMPRTERPTGGGHRDFAVSVDPFLGMERAAGRRDFTINAIMRDVLTGELFDPFGGREDLRRGVIRHVCAETFVEDPLRVLRAAQFAARFGFSVAPETIALSRTMELGTLAGERIWGELTKALQKAEHPSVFFETLREMEQLDTWFPEIKAFIGVPQEPLFHPEGDVWNHTMLVLDEAAALREEALYPTGFLVSALVHDFGKVSTTSRGKDGRLHAIGHETAGIPLAERFLCRMTNEKKLRSYVTNMVLLHMQPNKLAKQKSRPKSTNHLFDSSVCPEDLLLLAKADALGRTGVTYPAETEKYLQERLRLFRETMARPSVQGADLVAAGLQPGRDFSEILAYAHKLRLAGVEKESALRQTLAYARKLRRAAAGGGACAKTDKKKKVEE